MAIVLIEGFNSCWFKGMFPERYHNPKQTSSQQRNILSISLLTYLQSSPCQSMLFRDVDCNEIAWSAEAPGIGAVKVAREFGDKAASHSTLASLLSVSSNASFRLQRLLTLFKPLETRIVWLHHAKSGICNEMYRFSVSFFKLLRRNTHHKEDSTVHVSSRSCWEVAKTC